MRDTDRAARVIAAEATRYLAAVDTFAREGCDPHAAARSRARLAREREAQPHGRSRADLQREERRRARRIAAREREHDRRTAPLRFAPCTLHGIEPCPDPCPYYRQRLRAAGLEEE